APPADADAAATTDTTEPVAQPVEAAEVETPSMEASAPPAHPPAADTSEGTLAELLAALQDVTGERLSTAALAEAGLRVDLNAITEETVPRDAPVAHEPAAAAPGDVDTDRVDATTDIAAAAGVPAEAAPEAPEVPERPEVIEAPLADWES